MRLAPLSLIFLMLVGMTSCTSTDDASSEETGIDPALLEHAQELTQHYLIVDGHIDVPYRMTEFEEDITQATEGGDFDYPRAKAGGLNAPFMSIFIPSERQATAGASKALADSLIDLVEGFAERAPDKYAIATSVADARRHKEAGLISLPMGMENGAGIENDLTNLQHFYDRGIRYITLTHGLDNRICDSSYDDTRTWNGLSPFGEQVVDEMNRLGIIVDVSHISDSTFYQVMDRVQAPVFASHSSLRHFTPGWERNMNDDMLNRLAANDGVVMVTFGSSFLSNDYREQGGILGQNIADYISENNLPLGSREAAMYREEQRKANPIGTVADIADHIDHVVNLVGVDHVGLGSDFDGVTALPRGMQDVSMYPNLVAELLQRGYTDEDIGKILGGNALRVWEGVERAAQNLQLMQ